MEDENNGTKESKTSDDQYLSDFTKVQPYMFEPCVSKESIFCCIKSTWSTLTNLTNKSKLTPKMSLGSRSVMQHTPTPSAQSDNTNDKLVITIRGINY